jgi:2-C-methyl-D-erythritol 4-phosphate cytidylyltransferase
VTRTGPVWVVVVAAGSGSRFGVAKQFAPLRGRTLVEWSVDAARAVADGVVVVVPEDALGGATGAAAVPGADAVDAVVAGAATRSGSVRAGLAAVPPEAEVVVVHDGARPLASPALFRAVVEALSEGADGAVPGVAVADTLKRMAGDLVVSTVDRHDLVAVQTPQAFRAEVLRRAHATGDDATDDAALLEALGATVRVVPGDPRNIKVTTAADLELADALAGR